MEKQQTFASVAWTQKGKVTRRERFLAAEPSVPGFTDIRPEARITFERRLRKLQRALGLRKD